MQNKCSVTLQHSNTIEMSDLLTDLLQCNTLSQIKFLNFPLFYMALRSNNGVSLNILLTILRRYFFSGSFMFFCLMFVMPLCVSGLFVPCGHLLGKG